MHKKKLKYRVTYLEMNRKPSFGWPKNFKHKLSILLAESFPAWYFLFFYKQVGKKLLLDRLANKKWKMKSMNS